ncbi:glycogen/starch synthase [Candidatus Woesearchaeota archaeon]|nr:glycogen/starch synthase [Candidatus Woesearchaeota archaeon]
MEDQKNQGVTLDQTPSADFLFEASWEVCNKVGGIYTVVKSKAALMVQNYSDKYFLVGPYFEDKAKFELEEQNPPETLASVFKELESEGIRCHFGTWNVKGNPQVILIDSSGLVGRRDEFKKMYWDSYQVDSLYSQWSFDEPMIWATAVGKLLEKFQRFNPNKDICAHCHEWLAGFAILYLKANNARVATVFTTHATMLGRSIAGSGRNLYSELEYIDPAAEAYHHGIQDKFTTERAAANAAVIFTTVSEITGIEAEKILGRKPEILVLNGLDIGKFPTFEEISIKHQDNRDQIREFLTYYFMAHYSFDIDETLNFFIVGRYEFKNKGIDIMIKALKVLNERLKAEQSKKTVVAFFWIPRDVRNVKQQIITNKQGYRRIHSFIDKNKYVIGERLEMNIVSNKNLTIDLFDRDFLNNVKKLRLEFMQKGNPVLCTHDIPNEHDDIIIRSFNETGLDNKEDDRVKVVYYPVYLTGADGLIDLSYYEAIVGCHLGIFPSYYEPWGYTPLESAALGVPSITSDLAGFGMFMNKNAKQQGGIYVLRRRDRSEEEQVSQFADIMYKYTNFNRAERVEQKLIAKNLSGLADWKVLIKNYIDAHNSALARCSAIHVVEGISH